MEETNKRPMKTLLIYTSQTGFTKKYAEWIQEETQAVLLTLDQAKKKNEAYFQDFDAILYGGWAMGGKIVQSKWFLEHAENWKGKKLALFCVGASPDENPDVEKVLHDMLTDSQRDYLKAFYCQGGINYDQMKLPSKLAMKAFASALKKKKDATDSEKRMAEMISKSYDISSKEYIQPILDYLFD